MIVSVGPEYQLQSGIFKGRVRAAWMPPPYVNVSANIGQSMGFYGANSTQIIKDILGGAFYFEAALGVQDVFFDGFTIDVGYALMLATGGTAGKTLLNAILGTSLVGESNSIRVTSYVHNLTVHAGYRWHLGSRWELSAHLGLIKPLTGYSQMDLKNQFPAAAANLNRQFDSFMDSVFRSAFIPTASVTIVWRIDGENIHNMRIEETESKESLSPDTGAPHEPLGDSL